MKEHIAKVDAVALAKKADIEWAFTSPQERDMGLCNAAIQHYINQQAKELPVLPEPVDLIQAVWRGDREWMCPSGFYYTADQLQAYGLQCAAHAREMALSEVAEWIRPQRNDVPCTGDEFADAILYWKAGK